MIARRIPYAFAIPVCRIPPKKMRRQSYLIIPSITNQLSIVPPPKFPSPVEKTTTSLLAHARYKFRHQTLSPMSLEYGEAKFMNLHRRIALCQESLLDVDTMRV